jgi:hypothetical protein
MYQICVILLKIVRRYCVYHCGESWHNLWADLIGDAGCQKPSRPQPTAPEVLDTITLQETALKLASNAQLLTTVLAADHVNLFDVEDTCGYLSRRLEWFQEQLDQLPVDRPLRRNIRTFGALYDQYRHNFPEAV